jgi:hypothetical protein
VTGFVIVHGACFGCSRAFAFHPNKVPSINIAGSREPICIDCVNLANPLRIANGLEPITPLPGAYEAAPEHEVNWDG